MQLQHQYPFTQRVNTGQKTSTWYLIACQEREITHRKSTVHTHPAFIRGFICLPTTLCLLKEGHNTCDVQRGCYYCIVLVFQKNLGILFLNSCIDILLHCQYCITTDGADLYKTRPPAGRAQRENNVPFGYRHCSTAPFFYSFKC